MLKELAKQLQEPFTPKGPSIAPEDLTTWRVTGPHDVYRCCRMIGHDVQSGPMHCGDIADFVADGTEKGYHLAYCRYHVPRRCRKQAEAEEE